MESIPRAEHPTPQFMRENWINLNGQWEFEIDYPRSGKERAFEKREHLDGEITVPFCPESSLSGIGNTDFIECVWYKRAFSVPDDWRKNGRRTFLHIGACDYITEVWINGEYAGNHNGGSAPFSFDITECITDNENTVTVCATDQLREHNQPAGKQSKILSSCGCHYTRTTGIWQTVWLENMPEKHIDYVSFETDNSAKSVVLTAECSHASGMKLKATASYKGKPVGTAESTVKDIKTVICLKVDELYLWSPESPDLYDLEICLGDDTVFSYFGMRDIDCKNGTLILNEKPIFQRLILDQGFYPDGIWTAPDDNELLEDIRRSKRLGFNGARLHQKVFEPRFLYHCDREGYLVWGEYPNWGLDLSKGDAWAAILPEWTEIVKRDFNHPAIIGWCPLNEINKDSDPELIRMLFKMTKALDPGRLYIESSGWTHKENIGDIVDIHDYEGNPKIVEDKYNRLANGEALEMSGCDKKGFPTFVSEYGGIRLGNKEDGGWGYGTAPSDENEWLERYKAITEIYLNNPHISAFCYTQLTDVEQEVNGLYTYDRKLKFDAERIRAVNIKPAFIEQEHKDRTDR